ncbi:MAG: DUF4333 domain-containing protein [Candidatus Nanopelagicales bacterium]
MRASMIVIGVSAMVAAASVSGCSSNLDIDKLETTVADGMKTQLNLSDTPTVTCPDSVPIEAGNVFTCTAELNGDSVEVKVTQQDDQGNVTWETVQPSDAATP